MPDLEMEFTNEEFKYLNLLAKQYPNITSASTEIINLQAILNLPKGTSTLFLIFTVSMKRSAMCSEMLQALLKTI